MQFQSVIVALILGLIVVLGASTALYVVTTDTGTDVNETGSSLGNQLECVLSNKKQAQDCGDESVEDTAVEYRGGRSYEA